MNLELEIEFSKADLLKYIDTLKMQIDDMQLSDEIKNRVMQKLRLDWNYNSNAIEGNKLNYGETVAFLMTGITAKGKPLKDYLDIKGHNEAILFLTSIVKEDRPLMEADIRALHKMILVEPYEVKAQTADGSPTSMMISIGEYKTQANHVQTVTGEIHYYSSPEETPIKMRELMVWYKEANTNPKIHPVVVAALLHHKFVEIHPFDDGNGRLSRILMNLILMKNSYPPAIIKMDDRQNYYALLSQADVNDSWPFVEYIAERLESSLQLYLKAAKGEDINEDDDVDKQIDLFKMELESKLKPKIKVGNEEINAIILTVIYPLIHKLLNKLLFFDTFFEEMLISIETTPNGGYILKDKNIFYKGINVYEEINHLILSKVKIDSIHFMIKLNDFKNPDYIFNISKDLIFKFEDQEYSISDHNKDINVYKHYNESLSSKDEKDIIMQIVKDLKSEIDEQFNDNS